MTLTEHRYPDRRIAIVLHDGRRLVAKISPLGIGGYMVRGYGLSLLDKKPYPQHRDGWGIINPSLYHAKTVREARRMINCLAQTGAAK